MSSSTETTGPVGRERPLLGRVMWALLALGLAATGLVTTARPAEAQVVSFSGEAIVVEGLGWGHGRGMSQWGALGYAVDHGWSSAQIVDHYYGGTVAGDPVPNDDITVHLTAFDRRTLRFYSASPFHIGEFAFAGGQAAEIAVVGRDAFTVRRATGGCDATFDETLATAIPGTAGQAGHPYVEAVPDAAEQGPNLTDLLVTCLPRAEGGFLERAYRGALRVVEIEVADGGGVSPQPFSLNRLPLETYLRGVVPRESPAAWGLYGEGRGLAALEAQAIAARSYAIALAEARRAGGVRASDACDTTACQVYGGAFVDGIAIDAYDTTTSAIANTAGIVRRWPSGEVALTEFSSSSGGWTAPLSEGNPFGDVQDLGDGYTLNPHRPWTTTIPVADIEAAYPDIGDFVRIDVTRRNGLGQWGGRVRQLKITGTDGSRTVDFANWAGDTFRRMDPNRIRSDWYRFPDFPASDDAGFWVAKSDGTVLAFGAAIHYGDMSGTALNQPIVGMAGHPSGEGYWLVAADGGIFSFGAAGFHGSTGDIRLNQPIVGMAAHPSGQGYWMVASDGGIFSFGAAQFLGSMGDVRLNAPVVGMAAHPSGEGYWMVASDGGIFSFGAAGFHGSTGHIRLNQPIVGMTAHPTGRGYWFVASDGGVFSFGNVDFFGSRGGRTNRAPVIGMASTSGGRGYWLVLDNGTSFPFGDGPDYPSSLAGPRVVDVATKPSEKA